MSYLDVPRLHFFGNFTANPSTLNNDPTNYEQLEPPFQPPPQLDPGWNPDGDHTWAFQGCTVQTVIGPEGSPAQDPLVGTAVSSTGTEPNSNPKLVDLDPEQQLVSTIFGLQIQIGDAASGWVQGYFQPQPFLDLTGTAAGWPGAYYQSVLQNLTWSTELASPVLQELRKISPDALSIKFDLVQAQQGPPASGSITGTIGPASPGAPANFLLGRLMRPVSSRKLAVRERVAPQAALQGAPPSLNYTPFVVDGSRGKVVVDFGNSQAVGGPDTMQVAILPSQGSPQVLGTVDTTQASYQAMAAIQEFNVTAEQISLLQSSILGVLFNGSPILAEDASATSLAVTPMVFRLNPGDSAQVDLVALSFGVPAASQTIQIQIDNNQLQPSNDPNQPVGTPTSALQFPASVTTDANGRASFTLTATPEGPGHPRSGLDGQVYGVGFNWPLSPSPDPWIFVSVHVYDLVPVPASPDWQNDVLPILGPYHDLYPFMAQLINLADPAAVLESAQAIAFRMQVPIADPRHMPVTRDLSANKRQIVLNWLQQQAQSGPGGTTGG